MIDLINQYYQNPINKRQMPDASISQHEGNSVCGDDITVFLNIKDNQIIDRSYDGNTSMITTAAASFFSELIVGKTLAQALTMTYENTMVAEGFEVTPRRKRAGAIAILATKNAIHAFLQDGKRNTWENVVDL
ncbi:MAG: iron-sulfur cluster assembly scaffold protein [Candidatus Absconditabacterales bacterium]